MFGSLLGITAFAALIVILQWPMVKQQQKKERAAFIIFTAIGWSLSLLLVIFPEMPGLTTLVNFLYKPLGYLLK
ncbi:MAG TPA: hypothetical protein VF260_09210 [Bacilli bacterium]